MRSVLHLAVLLAASAGCGAAGWWLGRSMPAGQVFHDGVEGRPAPPRAGETPAMEVDESVALPVTGEEIRRKMLAQARTPDLWNCFLKRDASGYSNHDPIFRELVDRLGWAAWGGALALEDPAARKEAAAGILVCLAKKDPWRAFETWRDHRRDFSDDADWGKEVVKPVLDALGHAPAAMMIEVMRSLGDEAVPGMSYPEYSPDFDFAAVMNFLAEPGHEHLTRPWNLVESWARQSPVAASRWFMDHGDVGTFDATRVMFEVAIKSPGSPGRAEALEILNHLPAGKMDELWAGTYTGDTRETLPAPLLEAATAMNHREAFIVGMFRFTVDSGTLDASWQQLPAAERRMLLQKIDDWRDENQDLSAVQRERWERWKKMAATAWGMAE